MAIAALTGCSLLTDLDALTGGVASVGPDAAVDGSIATEGGTTLLAITPSDVKLGIRRNTRFTVSSDAVLRIAEGAAGGHIDATGLYVAPDTVGTYTVVATSTVDPSVTATAKVTVGPLKVDIVAGRYGGMGTADGSMQYAHFMAPSGFAALSETKFLVSDRQAATIRVVDRATSTVQTFAGVALESGTADGAPGTARLQNPFGIVEALGGVFVFGASCVRRVDQTTRATSTFAGDCNIPSSIDGKGAAARISSSGTAARVGNTAVFCDGNLLRKLDLATADVTTVSNLGGDCKTGPHTFAAATAFLVGDDLKTFDGDAEGTIASVATLPGGPRALCVGRGFALVASDDNVIRRVDLATKEVSVFSGTPGSTESVDGAVDVARFSSIQAIQCDFGDDGVSGLIADGSAIRSFSTKLFGEGVTTRTAPAARPALIDGAAGVASFMQPIRVAVDKDRNVFVSDVQLFGPANVIRRVDSTSRAVTTFAGAPSVAPLATNEGVPAKDGPGAEAILSIPIDLRVGDQDLVFADFLGAAVRRVSLSTRNVTTLAGKLNTPGFTNGTGPLAQFRFQDAADNSIFGGYVTFEGDSVVVGENGNHAIRRVVSATGVTTTIAGGSRGFADGTGETAQFEDIKGVYATGDGRVYVLDRQRLRVVDLATREVKTLAGANGEIKTVDGPFATARFGYFVAGALDPAAHAIYVSEGDNSVNPAAAFPVLRRIDLVDETVTTILGTPGQIGLAPRPLPTTIGCAAGLSVAANGDVFFVDRCDWVIAVLTAL